jgi:molybdate transport system substrate-binding protein
VKRRAALVIPLVVVVAGALLTGCGKSSVTQSSSGSTATKRTLVVFAAASLKESFTSLAHSFEARHPGLVVKLSFAGSDTLAASINAGAPVDVFAAASTKTLSIVTDAKHGSGQPVAFARNQLEIAVPAGNPKHIARLADTTKPGTKLVLCAATVPCGAAAQKAYTAGGIKANPVSFELDVKSVLNKVQLGEADAGLVYVSDVKTARGKVEGVAFPESAKAIATYPIVGVDTGKDAADARAFIAYVLSPAGQDVLTGNGFLKP